MTLYHRLDAKEKERSKGLMQLGHTRVKVESESIMVLVMRSMSHIYIYTAIRAKVTSLILPD